MVGKVQFRLTNSDIYNYVNTGNYLRKEADHSYLLELFFILNVLMYMKSVVYCVA